MWLPGRPYLILVYKMHGLESRFRTLKILQQPRTSFDTTSVLEKRVGYPNVRSNPLPKIEISKQR